MRFATYLLSCIITLSMLGCGGSRMTTTTTTPPPSGLNGSFGMTAVSTGPDTFLIGGPIQTTPSGSVSGTMRIDSTTSACFDFFTPLTFTGTLSSSGQLLLTSSAFQSQVINVTGTVSTGGKTISGGSFTITGGCAAGIHGALTGFQVAAVNGTYTGSFTAGASTIGISVVLSQSAPPNPFGLSGTATFTNAGSCSLSPANITAFETGFIAGSDVRATMMDSTLTVVASLRGLLADSTAKTLKGTLFIPNGPCAGAAAPITLTAM